MPDKPSVVALRKTKVLLSQFLGDSLKGQVQVLLPQNLSKQHLLDHTPAGIPGDKWLSIAYYFVQSICLMTLDRQHKFDTRPADGWVSLSYKVLRSVAGRAYKASRASLIELGVIECDEEYDRKKGISYGYRLGKQYREQYFKYRTIPDTGVRARVLEHQKKRLEEEKPRVLQLAHLAHWVMYGKLELDKSAALEYLARYKQAMLQNLQALNLDEQAQRRAVVFVNSRYYRARNQVERWGRNFNLRVDDKGGRLYSPITSLMSPLRDFLTYDGQPLVSFDIKNSQPLHFVLMLRQDFWKSTSRSTLSLAKLDADLWRELSKDEVKTVVEGIKDRETTPSNKSHRTSSRVGSKEVKEYEFAQIALTGNLYEFNSEQFKGKYFINVQDRFGTRTKTKVEILRLMYFNPKRKHSPAQDTFREFKKLFPFEARVMELLKSRSRISPSYSRSWKRGYCYTTSVGSCTMPTWISPCLPYTTR